MNIKSNLPAFAGGYTIITPSTDTATVLTQGISDHFEQKNMKPEDGYSVSFHAPKFVHLDTPEKQWSKKDEELIIDILESDFVEKNVNTEKANGNNINRTARLIKKIRKSFEDKPRLRALIPESKTSGDRTRGKRKPCTGLEELAKKIKGEN